MTIIGDDTFRCPVCGWVYEADVEHERMGLAKDEDCDFSQWVPCHHLAYAPVLCEGSFFVEAERVAVDNDNESER